MTFLLTASSCIYSTTNFLLPSNFIPMHIFVSTLSDFPSNHSPFQLPQTCNGKFSFLSNTFVIYTHISLLVPFKFFLYHFYCTSLLVLLSLPMFVFQCFILLCSFSILARRQATTNYKRDISSSLQEIRKELQLFRRRKFVWKRYQTRLQALCNSLLCILTVPLLTLPSLLSLMTTITLPCSTHCVSPFSFYGYSRHRTLLSLRLTITLEKKNYPSKLGFRPKALLLCLRLKQATRRACSWHSYKTFIQKLILEMTILDILCRFLRK